MLDKTTSARFIVTLAMTFTFCLITFMAMRMVSCNLNNDKVMPLLEKILFFILGSFTTQVTNVITSYFDRSDRKTTTEGK